MRKACWTLLIVVLALASMGAARADAQVMVEDVPRVHAQDLDSDLAQADNLLLSAETAEDPAGDVDDAVAILSKIHTGSFLMDPCIARAISLATDAKTSSDPVTDLIDARAQVEFVRALLTLN